MMTQRSNAGGALGLGLVALIMVFYVIGLAALAAHARYQAQQLAELAAAREVVSAENAGWSVQNMEIVRDNLDLRWLLGQRPQDDNYPASNDPSVDPNPDD